MYLPIKTTQLVSDNCPANSVRYTVLDVYVLFLDRATSISLIIIGTLLTRWFGLVLLSHQWMEWGRKVDDYPHDESRLEHEMERIVLSGCFFRNVSLS